MGIALAPRTARLLRLMIIITGYFLRLEVAANQWDGTIEGAYAGGTICSLMTGLQILIQNVAPKVYPPNPLPGANASDGMHIILSLIGPPIDALTQALFTGGYLNMVPAGVKVDAYVTQTVPGRRSLVGVSGPLFQGDYFSPPVNLGGWGIGCWGNFCEHADSNGPKHTGG